VRFGSVCSGIEAASVAWHPLGWKAAWLSEIEPFPSAVLAHHYPDVPNLGDMTTLPERILSGEVEAPDLFCGGTPCQAFSVAGLRNSLDDARGNLSLTFVGIANAIDHVRSVRRDAPGIIFWENVPGVLSTKDNAFGCFLGALAGEDEPIIPSGEKWTNAGCVYGPQRAVAWRVLDAQYFGVAQRRRRVFVVASARDGFDPAKILFEFDSVRRDTAPSREAGKTIAPCVTNGPPFSRTGNERVEAEAMVVQSKQWPADIASTLDTTFGTKQGLEDQHVNAGCPLFVPAQTFSIPAIGHIVQDEVASTMTRHTGSGSGETQNPAFVAQPIAFNHYRTNASPGELCPTLQVSKGGGGAGAAVAEPISIHPHCIGRAPEAGPQGKEYLLDGSAYCMDSRGQPQAIAIQDVRPVEKAQNGKGWNDDGTAYTVDTHATQGVAQPIDFRNLRFHEGDLAGTMQSKATGGYSLNYETGVMQPIPLDTMNMTPGHSSGGLGFGQPGDPSFTLTKGHSHAVAQPIPFDTTQITSAANYSKPKAGDPCHPLAAGAHPPAVAQPMAVRRLTPVECERLQGFPDGYTNIPWRKKPEAPDGPRYKALGNSWAVPVVRWIGHRIQQELNK
jgi:DNA (cytosine-5)-methyltransferase 1